MTAPARLAPPPRERIIDAARDLFRKHGIRGIGVDAIAEAAESNKMTLYRHFGSKDDLVVVCIERAAAEAEDFWTDLKAAHPDDPKAQLQDWVRRAGDFVTVAHCNCELLDAAAQLVESDHPARHVVEEIRKGHKRRLAALCRDAGVAEPDLLVDALTLLIDGAAPAHWVLRRASTPSPKRWSPPSWPKAPAAGAPARHTEARPFRRPPLSVIMSVAIHAAESADGFWFHNVCYATDLRELAGSVARYGRPAINRRRRRSRIVRPAAAGRRAACGSVAARWRAAPAAPPGRG